MYTHFSFHVTVFLLLLNREKQDQAVKPYNNLPIHLLSIDIKN